MRLSVVPAKVCPFAFFWSRYSIGRGSYVQALALPVVVPEQEFWDLTHSVMLVDGLPDISLLTRLQVALKVSLRAALDTDHQYLIDISRRSRGIYRRGGAAADNDDRFSRWVRAPESIAYLEFRGAGLMLGITIIGTTHVALQ
jgi:hypothetical protein